MKGGGGGNRFPLFKSGAQKFLPCLEEGVQTVLDPQLPRSAAPLPVINDQSLNRIDNKALYELSELCCTDSLPPSYIQHACCELCLDTCALWED